MQGFEHRIRLIGFPGRHATLLAEALGKACKTSISADLKEMFDTKKDEASILVVYDADPQHTVRDMAIELRTRHFVWMPVVLLQVYVDVLATDVGWAIYTTEFPPDIGRLLGMLHSAQLVSENRRQEILHAAIIGLWQDSCQLLRVLDSKVPPSENSIRLHLHNAVAAIPESSDITRLPEIEELKTLSHEICEVPGIGSEVLERIREVVVRCETTSRDMQAPNRLRTTLHRLSNTVRLMGWAVADVRTPLGRIEDVIENFPRTDCSRLAAIQDVLDEIKPSVLPLLRDMLRSTNPGVDQLEPIRAILTALVEHLASFVAGVRNDIYPLQKESGVQRILLVEDDVAWRTAIFSVLSQIAGTMPIHQAETVEEAEAILDDSPIDTLVLIDLGLPHTSKDLKRGNIDLDAGLDLMRRFAKRRPPKFIVLTAAQNYVDAVRRSLEAGVEAADYIQKDPQSWEDQVRSRVLLALQSPKALALPRVLVFGCTARLVSVNGIEIALDHKPYLVFEYLATRSRRWCTVESMRRHLSMPGPNDITPPLPQEQAEALKRGGIVTPFDLLTAKHVQEHVSSIRRAVSEAFTAAGHPRDVPELIVLDTERQAYKLDANVVIHTSFNDIAPTAFPQKVLVVEDHPQWNNAISDALRSLSFETKQAFCVADVERVLTEWVPDIITLDLQIPRTDEELKAGQADEANALSLLESISARFPGTRFTVLTSVAWNDSLMLSILQKGVAVHDYISKDWDNAVDRLLQSVWYLSLEMQRESVIPRADSPERIYSVAISPTDSREVIIQGTRVCLSTAPAVFFTLLANSPNAPVTRDTLIDGLWSVEELSDSYEDNLNTVVRRLRKEITEQTEGKVNGKELIRSADGVYWLHGVVVRTEMKWR